MIKRHHRLHTLPAVFGFTVSIALFSCLFGGSALAVPTASRWSDTVDTTTPISRFASKVSGSNVTWFADLTGAGAPTIYSRTYNGSGEGTAVAALSTGWPSYDLDGSVVVWSAGDGSDDDIFMSDIGGGAPTMICDATNKQTNPAIANGLVVWVDYRNSTPGTRDLAQIWGWSLVTGEFQIPTGIGYNGTSNPVVSASTIAWTEYNGADGNDVYVYDVATASVNILPPTKGSGAGNQTALAIDGSVVVFMNEAAAAVQVVDVSNPVSLVVVTESFGDAFDISGPIVSWIGDQGGGVIGPRAKNIYTEATYDLDVPPDELFQGQSISGTLMVWSTQGSDSSNIYWFDLSSYTGGTDTGHPMFGAGYAYIPASVTSFSLDGATLIWADDRLPTESIHARNFLYENRADFASGVDVFRLPKAAGDRITWVKNDGYYDTSIEVCSINPADPDYLTPVTAKSFEGSSVNVDDVAYSGSWLAWEINSSITATGPGGEVSVPVTGGYFNSEPDISGDTFVWTNRDIWNASSIYSRTMSAVSDEAVASSIRNQRQPVVSGNNIIVWEEVIDSDNTVIRYKDGSGIVNDVTGSVGIHTAPDIDGDRVVWIEYLTGEKPDVFMKDLGDDVVTRLTDDSNDQESPQISGTRVAWLDNRDGEIAVYGTDLVGQPEGSLEIGNMLAATNNPLVTLYTVAAGATSMRLTNDGTALTNPDAAFWTDWTSYTGTIYSWDLRLLQGGSVEGVKTVCVQYRDDATGLVSDSDLLTPDIYEPYSDTIIFDETVPGGEIFISSGLDPLFVGSRSVGVYLNPTPDLGSDIIEYQLTNTSGEWPGTWNDFDTPSSPMTVESYLLAEGPDGPRTVYARFRDAAGNVSSEVSDSVELLTAGVLTGTITLEADYTLDQLVSVVLTAEDNGGPSVTDMRLSNDPRCDPDHPDNSVAIWDGWKTYPPAEPITEWDLTAFGGSAAEGATTVYFQLRDDLGFESTIYEDTIIYDATAPTGGTVSINDGSAYTTSTTVVLTLFASDEVSGMSQMRLSNDGVFDSPEEDWGTYATSSDWTLASGDGAKTVYVQFRDKAGNETTGTISSQIELLTIIPEDFLVAYDYTGSTRVWSFGLNIPDPIPSTAWYSGPGFDINRSKMVRGDFNDDNKSEIAVLYDYGFGSARLWVIPIDEAESTPRLVWTSSPGTFDVSRSKLTSGDYDGDGRDEVGVLYNYAGSVRIWIYNAEAPNDNPYMAWYGAGIDWNKVKLISGDYDEDLKSEAGLLYDYGNSTTRIWTIDLDVANPIPKMAWYSGSGYFNAGRATPIGQ